MQKKNFELFKRLTIYQIIAVILTIFLILSIFKFGISMLWQTVIAVATAFVLDHLIVFIKEKKFEFNPSPIISGLFIGLLLSVNQLVSAFFAALFAIGIKHIIRIKGKHIFNPAASGLFVSALLFKAQVAWTGALFLYPIIILALLLHLKFKRFDLILSFLITYFVIFNIYNAAHGIYTFNFVNLILYFFASFMLVEPRTSPIRSKGRIFYGILAAFIIFILGFANLKFIDPLIIGLLISNLTVPLFNKIK